MSWIINELLSLSDRQYSSSTSFLRSSVFGRGVHMNTCLKSVDVDLNHSGSEAGSFC